MMTASAWLEVLKVVALATFSSCDSNAISMTTFLLECCGASTSIIQNMYCIEEHGDILIMLTSSKILELLKFEICIILFFKVQKVPILRALGCKILYTFFLNSLHIIYHNDGIPWKPHPHHWRSVWWSCHSGRFTPQMVSNTELSRFLHVSPINIH